MDTTTWDGLPIALDWPHGASIVVRRPDGAVLLLHRAHHGADYAGAWGWTTPAGSRQPGEAILPAALRELAEEAGLSGIDLAPVDLTGSWALFAAQVGADARITLVDVEHDQFEWVPPADAYARVRPRFVADGIRRALAVPLDPIGFAPPQPADLADLAGWRDAAHLPAWWPGPGTADLVVLGGRPVGFVQCTPLAAVDEEHVEAARWAADGDPEPVLIGYAIGDRAPAGRGLGTRVIWSYLHDVVLPRYPGTRFVIAEPLAADAAAVRAGEKAGFRRMLNFEPEPGAAHRALCVFDRERVTGHPVAGTS